MPPKEVWEEAQNAKNNHSAPDLVKWQPNNIYVEKLLTVWNVTPDFSSKRNIEIYIHLNSNRKQETAAEQAIRSMQCHSECSQHLRPTVKHH